MLQKIKPSYYIIAILVVIIFFIRSCDKSHTDGLIQQMEMYSDSAKQFQLKLKNGELVNIATNNALKIDNEQQLKALAAKDDTVKKLLSQFKDIRTMIITKQVITINHDTIKLEKRIPCDFVSVKFRQDTTYFNITGRIMPSKLIIDSLSIPDKQNIVIGNKRKGLLGRELTVDISHSNPLVSVNKIAGYVVEEKKWYQNKWLLMGGGFIAGSCINIFYKK